MKKSIGTKNIAAALAVAAAHTASVANDTSKLVVACEPIDATSSVAITSESIWWTGCKSKRNSDFLKLWSELNSKNYSKQSKNFSPYTIRVGMKIGKKTLYIDTEYNVMITEKHRAAPKYFSIAQHDPLRAYVLSIFGADNINKNSSE